MSEKVRTIKNNMIYVVLLTVTFLTTFCMLITFDYYPVAASLLIQFNMNVWR